MKKRKLVKPPDNEADRDKLVEQLKRDLEESLKEEVYAQRIGEQNPVVRVQLGEGLVQPRLVGVRNPSGSRHFQHIGTLFAQRCH